jgi:hypothetical protein
MSKTKMAKAVRWIDNNEDEALKWLLEFEQDRIVAIDGVKVKPTMKWFISGDSIFVKPAKGAEAIWATDLFNAKEDEDFLDLVFGGIPRIR